MPRPRTLALVPVAFVSGACAQDVPLADRLDEAPPEETIQTPEQLAEEVLPGWTLKLDPAVSYFALSGDIEVPGSAASGAGTPFDLGELNLDSPGLAPFGRLQLARGDFRASFTGATARTNREAAISSPGRLGPATVLAGDVIESDLSFQIFDLSASYRVFSRAYRDDITEPVRLAVSLHVLGGLRFYNVSYEGSVSPLGAGVRPAGSPLSTSTDQFFAEPILGAQLDVEIFERFSVEFTGSVGGFVAGDRTSASLEAGVGFTVRPVPNFGATIGYRILAFDLEDDDGFDSFEWDGAIAGLFWGIQLRF
ncbi:MAG: hypothetical protein AAFQ71_13795 [Planctomycetota bacterium]